jgi:hypothetical protein
MKASDYALLWSPGEAVSQCPNFRIRDRTVLANRCLLNVRAWDFLVVVSLATGRIEKDPACAGAGPAPGCRLR